MVRVLVHAVAACVLVVWFAPGGVVVGATAATRRLHVGRGGVAAGRAHSVLATPEGRVTAWGSGQRGQIGDGALVDRALPTAVPNLERVAVVSAGAAHTVAVTKDGEVYAWGANSFGRLGDGTRKRRARPVRIGGLTNVTSVAAGRAHTLALTADGRVFAWGRNKEGQLGVGNKITSIVPVQVRDLTDVVAIAAGDAHSLAVTRNGMLFAWGSNQFSTLGDGTSKDRLRPVAIALADVVSVAAGDGHSLALLRNGAVFSWGRGANGELGTGSTRIASKPAVVPDLKASAVAAGRRFSAAIRDDGNVMAWGANESGQLGDRSTTRRLRPVVVAGVTGAASIALGDAHAIAVTVSGDVRSWGAGDSGQLGNGTTLDRSSASEIISDIPDWGLDPENEEEPRDSVPPTITFTTTPPLQNGWMTAPVTVTFQCADDVGVASCPAPVVVETDGFAQRVSGTAVDLAGNQATTSALVSLDLTAPNLTITEPVSQTAIDGDHVDVTGVAFDPASGLADGRCNGEPAEIVDGLVRCRVPLNPGRNDIILHAIDAVGHNSSASVVVTRVGIATSLRLTPATRIMVVGEEARLSLHDEFGAAVKAALWSTGDNDVVSLSADEPPVLTAAHTGHVTIAAEKDGMIASASIEVVAALAPGTTRWTLPPLQGLESGSPLMANRVDESSPQMFTIESRDWEDATLRAVTSDGEVLWQQYVPGLPTMGDSFGGVVAGIYDANFDIRAYQRFGSGSTTAWRYQSRGRLETPAQAQDGTIYAIESLFGGLTIDGQEIWDKYAVVMDGATGGVISRTLFRREADTFTAAWDGMVLEAQPPIVCRSWYNDYPPETLGPVVGSDGRGYFVVRRHSLHMQADCEMPFRRRPDRSIDMGLDLVIVSRDAAPQTVNLFSTTCTGVLGSTLPCDLPVHALQIMPDGIGGTLVTWRRGTAMVGESVFVQHSMTRVTAEGSVDERLVSPQFWLEMMGQAGTAFTYDDGWKAMDVTTGEIKWAGALPNLSMLAARPDGGVATFDWTSGELKITDAAGEVESTQPFDLDWRAVQLGGDWIGLREGALTAVVGDFADATRWRALSGNAQGQQSVRLPGIGLWLKTHNAQEPLPTFQHISIRVTPFDQDWLNRNAATFENCQPLSNCVPLGRDVYGNRFFTIGAGAGTGDTNAQCSGQLTKGFNRPNDVRTPPTSPLKEMPVDSRFQAIIVNSILKNYEAYSNNLLYYCFPEERAGFYNSNSFTHGLLHAAGVPHDEPPPTRRAAPGWITPVPAKFFAR
jgi:alpha-tubulin suppressor-like RCC1 family protein